MDWTEEIDQQRTELRALNALIPDTARAFGGLGKAVKETGPLDFKTKEFMALGMAIVIRRGPCIGLHVEALVRAGATREEIGDVLAVAIQMGGGPAMMYAAHALACFDEMSAES